MVFGLCGGYLLQETSECKRLVSQGQLPRRSIVGEYSIGNAVDDGAVRRCYTRNSVCTGWNQRVRSAVLKDSSCCVHNDGE